MTTCGKVTLDPLALDVLDLALGGTQPGLADRVGALQDGIRKAQRGYLRPMPGRRKHPHAARHGYDPRLLLGRG